MKSLEVIGYMPNEMRITAFKIFRFKPLLSQKEIAKRQEWQDKTSAELNKIKKKLEMKILGKKFIILPNVFAPLWLDSTLLAKVVSQEIKQGDFVLDMGTGTGIQAIFAAKKASNIVAVDKNPEAIKCAKLNIKKHKLENRIKVIKSDLFSNIKTKFDIIIFNPPFRWFKPKNILEQGGLDENYKTLTKFFTQAIKYLKNNGCMILVFSDSGDMKYFKKLIELNNFKSKILTQAKKDGWKYFIYKLKQLRV